MDPLVARKTWRTLEPVHGMIYFVSETAERYAKVGLKGNRMGYFASRSAAMGRVSAETVAATFFNFNPSLVHAAIPAAWDLASPADILGARLDSAGAALRRGLGDDVIASPDLAEAASLVSRAARAASERPAGRPLFAAHAGLDWPDEPQLVLWHAQTLLREYRGDGHITALVDAELDPVEALITHAASGEVNVGFLRISRAWPDEAWDAGVDRLRTRGVIAPPAGDDPSLIEFTDAGRALRQTIEDRTDRLCTPAYAALGDADCARLRDLGRPISKAIVAAGLLTVDSARLSGDDA